MFVGGFKKGVDLGFHTLEYILMDDVIPDLEAEQFITKKMAIMPTFMIYSNILDLKRIFDLLANHGKEYLIPDAMKQLSGRISELITLLDELLSIFDAKA